MGYMRCVNKGIAVITACGMLSGITGSFFYAENDAGAAGKPALSAKNQSIEAGKTFRLKLKKGNKKAKVTWSTKKASIARITKKNAVGNKAFAIIKGIKAGKTTITAKYKLKKKVIKLTCTVSVTDKNANSDNNQAVPSDNGQQAQGSPTAAPVQNGGGNVAQTGQPTTAPTAEPTAAPTATPVPTPTPIPFENLVEVNELKEQKTIPDIFTYIDGTPVTAENWEGRAEEIRQMYQYYMYGMWRDGSGETVTYDRNDKKLKINIETSGSEEGQVQGGNASFEVEVVTPDGTAPEKGWPVIIALGSLSEQQYALDNGYAVINYDVGQVSSDSAARQGAFYTLYPYNMKEWHEQTGVLMAWAWGASKVLDALYEGAGADYGINPDFAIVGGVSRYGKATAITGAFDRRFKIALPTCSGCGGMGVFRYNPDAKVTQEYDVSSLGYMDKATYKQGDIETLGSIQSSGEAFWFNQRFLQFRSIYNLPFDQHFLSALYASEGRTLMLIGGFNYDIWQNTPSLWYNFCKAKEVFDMLGLSDNIIINLHDAAMGHNILNDDVVKLFKYCDEMYNGKDVDGFEINDMQTTLFEYTDTPSGINNKEVYEAQIPE